MLESKIAILVKDRLSAGQKSRKTTSHMFLMRVDTTTTDFFVKMKLNLNKKFSK